MAQQDSTPRETQRPEPAPSGLGTDWWSVLVGGALVALAALDLLPGIPW